VPRGALTFDRVTGRARAEEQAAILAAALARAAASAPLGVVVFDLDSTLLDNHPRQARIFQDYGQTAGLPALIGTRPEHVRVWGIEAALSSAGLSPAEVRRHRDSARRFWLDRFFTSAYCRLDVPLPGAPEFARAVAASGARVAYVTGRPERMRAGTLDVFRRFGFPPPDGARVFLLMKPDAGLGDDDWKRRACAEVAGLGPVVAAFDNEPAHVNGYRCAFPAALCVHLDTDHSPHAVPVDRAIPSIRDFTLVRAARTFAGDAAAP
jgi:hypothetical protein